MFRIKYNDARSRLYNMEKSVQRSSSAEVINRQKFSLLKNNISQFSQELNSRLKPLVKSSFYRGMKPFDTTKSISNLNLVAPFGSLLEKLEEITEKRNTIHFDDPLQDEEWYSIKLGKNEKAIFQVDTLNRVCPLKVRLRKSGNITIFVSSKHPIPDQNNHEKKFSGENFSISDTTFRFKLKSLFFCILAHEQSDISIQVEFKHREDSPSNGKFLTMKEKSQREMEKIRNDPELKQQFAERVENILASRRKKALQQAGYKNFVRINKSCQSAEERKKVIRSKSQEKLIKEKIVLERKELNYKEKLQRAKDVLIKQEQREQQRKQREELRKQHLEKMAKVKIWLKIVFFSRSLFELKNKFIFLKRAKRNSLKCATKIQKNYRRWNSQLFENISKQYIHARNTLLLFNTHSRYCLQFSHKKLLVFLSQQISIQKPFIVFEKYFSKVMRIQVFVRDYLSVRNRLLNRAIKVWVFHCRRLVKKLISRSPENTFLNQVIRIKDLKRDGILKEFIREKCHNKRVTNKNYRSFLPTKSDIFRLIKHASIDS